jgi:hypothetical protein
MQAETEAEEEMSDDGEYAIDFGCDHMSDEEECSTRFERFYYDQAEECS